MLKIREELYSPGAVIFHQGDIGESCVYIIKKGVVELYVQNRLLGTLGEGADIGTAEFFAG